MAETVSKRVAAPVFELKGRMATLTVVRLLTTDVSAFAGQLAEKIGEAPRLLRGAPMLLDLEALSSADIDLGAITAVMRDLGAVPVAVRGGGVDAERAAEAGLGLLTADNEAPRREEAPACGATARVVESPVRSGQQIYARGSDLVVLGAVSPGAEVLADGHIHVYGALRGRALAGVQGEPRARIFCTALEAELVSVAGRYQVSDRIDEALRGQPAQVRLDGETLYIEPVCSYRTEYSLNG